LVGGRRRGKSLGRWEGNMVEIGTNNNELTDRLVLLYLLRNVDM
jgi:hypothetical protein